MKGCYFAINKNVRILDHASGIRVSDCAKSTINLKNDDNVTIRQHDVIVIKIKSKNTPHIHTPRLGLKGFQYSKLPSGKHMYQLNFFIKQLAV